ncbi:hypothetical protein [Salinibacterium sp. M195]|uniref:hypothetical protein n=1 Tax=Salinibacterium sp. M195 TaxID=2583374 RepID=UPI001C637EC7|nr:hypothetical protein [Salinibacterium sp. M195]QYH36383.1 hypothetical protein FFT87_10715 [Salinibacterium sp. M195]
MVRSALAARRRLAALEWLLIAALVAAGVWLGVQGTATAHVDLPIGSVWDIEIGQTADDSQSSVASMRDVTVSFFWIMTSSGFVEISAYAESAAGLPNPAFTLILYCGAQLQNMDGDIVNADGTGFRDVTSLGDESACRSSDSEISEDRQRQVIHVVGSTRLSGVPIGTWTDSQAGQRLARTPSVSFISNDVDLMEVSASSIATAALTSSVTEQFDGATPPELVEGAVVYGSGWPVADENGNRETAAVQWQTAAKPENTQTMLLATGLARWTLPDGQSLPQWSLLFSGVLFGVASALLVEWPIAAYRSRLRTRAET